MKKGRKAEKLAADYLESQGYYLVAKNYFCYRGEIDLIAFDNDYVVFVEVRRRQEGGLLTPEESVTDEKQERLIKCAKKWIMENDYRGNARFDVLAITGSEINHYKDAFQMVD